MIFVIGAFFWVLALVVVWRLLAVSVKKMQLPAWAWGLMALMALGLLFRPHEDIFGGEDPGSYLNSGVSYGRQGQLFYVDPLLAQVPRGSKSAFYYGHAGYGTTKDACLWVVNEEAAVLGPHFQPAYPLLISVVTRLGTPSWSLYVVPLFAIFTGVALLALAARLLVHRLAGVIAFGCYLLNHLTLWHGRCSRPEIIAAFFAFAGLALLLFAYHGVREHTRSRGAQNKLNIVLGALCIGAAPLFHITAWYLAIPAALAVGLVILAGRLDFLLYPLAAFGMLLVFYGEARYVTDYYQVLQFFEAFLHWPELAIGLAGLAIIAGVVNCVQHYQAVSPAPEKTVSGSLAAALALVSLTFFATAYFNRESIGNLPILGSIRANFIFLTDWQTFANMVSWPMALIILAGWIVWLTGPRSGRPERIALALTVLPAVALAGTMRDFMMTRYLVLAVIPMGALCLTALCACLKEWPGRPATAWLAPVLTLLLALAGLTNRWHLVRQVDHGGFLNFLTSFARTIQQENGILLGEYSRITAPLEHMFGIPALGLDNERKDDYHAAERAWEAIMRATPDRAAFFLTPFQEPRSDRFDFQLVQQNSFTDRKLQQAYNNLPTEIRETPLALTLYRMKLKDPEALPPLAISYVPLALANGNMGLRRFANVRIEKPELEGVELAADEQVSLMIPADLTPNLVDLLFVLHCAESKPLAPLLQDSGAKEPEHYDFRFRPLGDQWWVSTVKLKRVNTLELLTLTASSPLFIAAAFGCSETDVTEIPYGFSKGQVKRVFPPLKGRWARASASILIPATAPGYVLILSYAPDTGATNFPSFITIEDEGNWVASQELRPGRWQWLVWPLASGITRAQWQHLTVYPAWNPRKAGFPNDLGIFCAKVIVAPSKQ